MRQVMSLLGPDSKFDSRLKLAASRRFTITGKGNVIDSAVVAEDQAAHIRKAMKKHYGGQDAGR